MLFSFAEKGIPLSHRPPNYFKSHLITVSHSIFTLFINEAELSFVSISFARTQSRAQAVSAYDAIRAPLTSFNVRSVWFYLISNWLSYNFQNHLNNCTN